jgi:hypothetical protein
MIGGPTMKERIPDNEKYLNQRSKRAMEEEGESPDTSHLYCLQLALWAIESGMVTTEKKIEDLLYQMMGEKPSQVMNLLESLPQHEEKEPGEHDIVPGVRVELVSPEEELSPEELAERIITHMESWYTEARSYDTATDEEE